MATILIIGGTRFSGYFATQYALARGHTVTLFNRGQSNPEGFPAAEHLRGDRDSDLDPLRGQRWDAVIDTCGYVPRVVRKSAELLRDQVGQYIFISSISAYADPYALNSDETAPLATLADPTVEEIGGAAYGGLKVLCERVVQEVFGERSTVVRPGLIVGPRDLTYRFNYWVGRIAQGGEVLAPGRPDQPVQFIDARDLGEWLIRLVEARTMGVFNAIGPAERLEMGPFLETSCETLGSSATLTWVDEDFLLKREVQPWSELPVWLPGPDGNMHTSSNRRATGAGLTFRPLGDTVRATHEWMKAHPDKPSPAGTLTADKESQILKEWHARS